MEMKTGTRELTVKFSLPYNHSDPEKYLETFEPYFGSIHSFYFDLPGIFYAHNPERNPSSPEKIEKELLNTLNFIRLASPHAQTVLCLNLLTYPGNHAQHVFNFKRELAPLAYDLGLHAVNVASPTVANAVHKSIPELDIQTSCNTYTFLNRSYYIWNERFGSTVFNLPREALRTPTMMNEFKKTGYISKCIVNEGCLYGCPGNIEHACRFFTDDVRNPIFCDTEGTRLSDIFRSNFIPPQYLKNYEGTLDIAKIAGRLHKTEAIHGMLVAYLNGDEEAEFTKISYSRLKAMLFDNNIRLYCKDFPQKIMTCECKDCYKCNICAQAMRHVLKKNQIDPSTLKIRI